MYHPNLTSLPTELVTLIYSFVDTWDLLCLCQVGLRRLEQVAEELLSKSTFHVRGTRMLREMLSLLAALKRRNVLLRVDLDLMERIDSYEKVEQVGQTGHLEKRHLKHK
jgi:hypothetical protein